MKALQALVLAATLLWTGGAVGVEPMPPDPAKIEASQKCATCHAQVFEARALDAPVDVHWQRACVECHVGRQNPHVQPDATASEQTLFARLSELTAMKPASIVGCAGCHEDEVLAWLDSAHGPKAGDADVAHHPSCRRCHGPPHAIRRATDHKERMLLQCVSCHGFAEEDKAPTNPFVVDTFRDTIHGKMLRLGNEDAAWCGDCHTAHAVYHSDDERSKVHESRIVATCAECHEGATEEFASTFSHTPPTEGSDFWAWIVTLFFSALTFGCIALLFVHVLLDFVRTIRIAIKGRNGPHPEVKTAEIHRDDEVPRFDIHQRLQHWGMMTSFTTLVVTGWPLKSASVGQTTDLVLAMGGPQVLSLIHRAAGALLIVVSAYHLIYLGMLWRRKQLRLTMLPGPKDLRDLIGNLSFFLGRRKERPRFGRYTYFEKFDYWAVFWGMLIMGGTGLVLWFPVETTAIMPGSFIVLSHIAHSDEALLAALAIFLWHFYNVHLRPSIFPMSWVWLTGRISAGAMYEEHVEEYERRFGKAAPEDMEEELNWQNRPWWSVVALWTVMMVAVGVASADLSHLRSKIDELAMPPDRELAAELAFPADRGAGPVPVAVGENHFDDCFKCHDKEQYETGEKYPHFDHDDDYFEDELEVTCGDCHEKTWHRGLQNPLMHCVQCHKTRSRKLRGFPKEWLEEADAAQPSQGED